MKRTHSSQSLASLCIAILVSAAHPFFGLLRVEMGPLFIVWSAGTYSIRQADALTWDLSGSALVALGLREAPVQQ